MAKIEITDTDVEEAFSKAVRGIVNLRDAPPGANRYGVLRHNSKSRNGVMLLTFRTRDKLEIDFEVDMFELQAHGRRYVEHVLGLLHMQIDKAREVRQEENRIEIMNHPINRPEPVPTATAEAVSKVIH